MSSAFSPSPSHAEGLERWALVLHCGVSLRRPPSDVKKALAVALTLAAERIHSTFPSLTAVVSALSSLEVRSEAPLSLFLCRSMTEFHREKDSGSVNAGRGSALNENGEVECDAQVMLSDGSYGAVAAVAGF